MESDSDLRLGLSRGSRKLVGCAVIALMIATAACGHKNVGSGLAPTAVGAPLAAPRAGLEPAPTISLADVLAQIDAYQPPKGVDTARFASLKAELKRLLIARASQTAGRDAGSTKDISVEQASAPADSGAGRRARQASAAGKTISIASAGKMNAVTDLAATVNLAGTQATLTWTEVLPGDYDSNGVVDIGDLIPLALYYGQRTDSGPDDPHRLVSGDANPEINIWDLGAIAANYGAHLQGYQVWRGHWNGTSTDWETAFLPNIADPANTAFSINRPSPPPASTRPSYTYTDDISGVSDKNNIRYKVTAFGDGVPGAESNEAAVPATTFSVSGKVTLLGNGLAGVTLTLAPGSMHATTQADGTYAISGVANGSYALTPTGTGYVFTPASIPVTLNGANVVGLDFTATGGLANSAWPKFHGNAQNTGQSPYIGAQTNRVKWTRNTGYFGVISSPTIGVDGTVYVGSTDSKLYALNPSDGSIKWLYAATNQVNSSPAVAADGTVYVGGSDYKVYALSPADGSVRWSFTTGQAVGSSPAIGANGTVYIGSGDKKVYALSPSDGSVQWSRSTGGYVFSSAALGVDGTVYVGSNDGNFYALSPIDGGVKWSFATGSALYVASPAIGPNGTVYVGSYDGRVYALSPADGSVTWAYTAGDRVDGSPAIGADGTLYIGCDYSVCALNSADGSLKWSHPTEGWVGSSPAVGADGMVYIGSSDKKVYALTPSDGSVKWSYATGGDVMWSSPSIGADGTVYVGSEDGKLYAFGGVGPSTYSVSGTVTLSGSGLAGVTMTLTPGGKTATTASDGTYKFTDILEGTYTLTPTATGYVFSPAQRSVTVKALDATGQDFAATGGLANSAWPKFHGNAKNTGQSPYVGAQTNALKWASVIGSGTLTSPAVGADGTVFVGSGDWNVYAVNPADGSIKWSYRTRDRVWSSPAIAVDGTVYIGSDDYLLHALDPADGSLKWGHGTSGYVGLPAIGQDGTIYVGCAGRISTIYAFNPVDGRAKWTHVTGQFAAAPGCPAIGIDGTVYIGSEDYNVYALNPADGSVKWSFSTGYSVTTCPSISADGTVYIGGGNGKLYALSPADGSVKWTSMIGVRGSSPAIGVDGTVYVGSDDGNVYALNPADGTVRWTYTTGSAVESSPAIGADGTVYIGSGDFKVYAISPFDGSVKWSYATGGQVMSSPAIGADGTVFVGSYDGKVYAFGP